MSFLALVLSVALNLIPAPVEFTPRDGDFSGGKTSVTMNGRQLRHDTAGLPDFARKEAYRITIEPQRIVIEAITKEGLFRARKSLEQLQASGSIPCGIIFDYPRFAHRGLMLDESRSFKGMAFIKKQIDAMALLKLNVLHLHLDDSAGWRIESETYPNLTAKTAWRIGWDYFAWEKGGYKFSSKDDPEASGGCYSKAELKEIVAYAARNFITVIPEIEMPGHSMEVGYAYPEVLCKTPDGKTCKGAWDLCPGSEATYTLLESILDEVMDIFPSPLIHIGGDEAGMKTWHDCPACRARMEQEGYTEFTFLSCEWDIIRKQYTGQIYVKEAYYTVPGYLPDALRQTCFDWYKAKTELKNVDGMEYEYMKSKNRVNSVYGMMVEKVVKNIIIAKAIKTGKSLLI